MSFLRALFGGNKPNVDELKANGDLDGLLKALTYKQDARIRLDAAQALGELGDQRAKKALHLALEDDDTEVRVAAQTALGKLIKDS